MPKYSYKCKNCDIKFYSHHSMLEKKTDCDNCGSTDVLIKLPSLFSLEKEVTEDYRPGAVVKRSIEDYREELELEKEKAKNEFFKPDG